MEIDNSVQLENRPLILQTNVDENTGDTVVTNVESATLDLHSLQVNKYNYQLKTLAKQGGASKIQVSISESDANILSLACLNPGQQVLESSLTAFGFDLGTPPIATMRKYCEVVAVPTLVFDSGNFVGISGSEVEIAFKLSSAEGSLSVGSNLLLSTVETAVVNGVTKLVSLSGKSWDGIEVKLMANADSTIGLAVGDSFWTQFVTRNEGLVVAPKVTGLDAPVLGSDAVNLDYVDNQVAILEGDDNANLSYIDEKIQELSDTIANQDSFFIYTEQRWSGPRALVFTASANKVELPNMSVLGSQSSVMGLALTNPVIDESGLSGEQIALSYNRRVYTAGMVRNVCNWQSPKGDVYAGPNGTLVEVPPTSGRIIKMGQKVNKSDLLLAIQDYGYVYGTRAIQSTYDFGGLKPSPLPPELGLDHFILVNDYSELTSSADLSYRYEGVPDYLVDIQKIGTQTLSESDGILGTQIKALSDDLLKNSKGKIQSGWNYAPFSVKSVDGSGLVSLVQSGSWSTFQHPGISKIVKFDNDGVLVASINAPLFGKFDEYNQYSSYNELLFEDLPCMLHTRPNGEVVYISRVNILSAGWSYLEANPNSQEAQWLHIDYVDPGDPNNTYSGPAGGLKAWVFNSGLTELLSVHPLDANTIALESYIYTYYASYFAGNVSRSDGSLIFPSASQYFYDLQDSRMCINKFDSNNVLTKFISSFGSASSMNGMSSWGGSVSGYSAATNPEVLLSNGDYLVGCNHGLIKLSSDDFLTDIPMEDLGNLARITGLSELPDGSVAMVCLCNGDNYVRKLNTDGTLSDPILIQSDFARYGYSRPDGSYVVVGGEFNNKITVYFIDFSTGSFTTSEVTSDEVGDFRYVSFGDFTSGRAVAPDGSFLFNFWRSIGDWSDNSLGPIGGKYVYPLCLVKPDNSVSVIHSRQPHQSPFEGYVVQDPGWNTGNTYNLGDGPGYNCFSIIH